jgi:hypothetical protein
MKPGDLVRIKIDPTYPDRQVERTGLILEKLGSHRGEPFFRVLVDGSNEWFMYRSDMRLIK